MSEERARRKEKVFGEEGAEGGAGAGNSRPCLPGTLTSSFPRSLWPEAEARFLESKGRDEESGADS